VGWKTSFANTQDLADDTGGLLLCYFWQTVLPSIVPVLMSPSGMSGWGSHGGWTPRGFVPLSPCIFSVITGIDGYQHQFDFLLTSISEWQWSGYLLMGHDR
jgi:hypothetical protein